MQLSECRFYFDCSRVVKESIAKVREGLAKRKREREHTHMHTYNKYIGLTHVHTYRTYLSGYLCGYQASSIVRGSVFNNRLFLGGLFYHFCVCQ